MRVLGIETSCDECAASVVVDGRRIESNVIASQISIMQPYDGVVPELASRKHIEWIARVVREALSEASVSVDDIDGVAATARPGLSGSLLVGFSFAKAFALARRVPFAAVDHILAHLYAPQLETEIKYPYLGLLVSGGHTLIAVVRDHDVVEVLGTTIDDAAGEAFDKVSKHLGLGYPGGVAIDQIARTGDPTAFAFPDPSLHKGDHPYDVSYSGLKTAVINQLDRFWNGTSERTPANIAASFQRAAVNMLVRRVVRAASDTGLGTVVVGGGVAANSYLRARLLEEESVSAYFPDRVLCTDNAAMIAGVGYRYLQAGREAGWTETVSARVHSFRRTYP